MVVEVVEVGEVWKLQGRLSVSFAPVRTEDWDQLGPAGGWGEAAANRYEVEEEAPEIWRRLNRKNCYT